jgi:hypothetical protein
MGAACKLDNKNLCVTIGATLAVAFNLDPEAILPELAIHRGNRARGCAVNRGGDGLPWIRDQDKLQAPGALWD